jgi:hypothetical protein
MMRNRLITTILTAALALQGCAQSPSDSLISDSSVDSSSISQNASTKVPKFNGMSDPKFAYYIQDSVYDKLIDELPEGYSIQNMQVQYVSQEYVDELEANSRKNVFFGYSSFQLEEAFPDNKYVFVLGDDGKTTVREFEAYDDTYDQVVRNVAVGTGVIVVSAVISGATGGSAPAVSVILAASSKTGAIAALSSGGISAAISGISTGVGTGDVDEALKAAMLSGSEGFMWGAIAGAATGGAEQFASLYSATKNGLSVTEVAQIQRDSKYPLDVIEQFKSMEEYNVYKNAGLKPQMVNGRTALTQKIDLDYKSELGGKTVTNLERMQEGYAPIDPASGSPYELHHINQDPNGTLAVLSKAQHDSKGLHIMKESEIDRDAFDKIRKEFWKSYAENLA